jgi:hypothetical protein
VVATAALALAGCGGGGGVAGTNVSGTSYKGPTAGAVVCAYRIDKSAAGKKGAKLEALVSSTPSVRDGCVVTGNDGTFNYVLPETPKVDVILESTGGTYCSDESIFDGTNCAGGGTPIVMGSNALRTLVSPPASGTLTTAPLTLLTTAAVDQADSLSPSSFAAAYATIATNFGLSDKSPSASPATGELKTVLAKLTDYVGADTTVLADVIAGIASGAVRAEGGNIVSPQATLQCTALQASDLQGPAGTFSSGFSTDRCTDTVDGATLYFYLFDQPIATALQSGQPAAGRFFKTLFTGPCSAPGMQAGQESTEIVAQFQGTQSVPYGPSANDWATQGGSANRLAITYRASAVMGFPEDVTRAHLLCRTRPADAGDVNFDVYLTSAESPLRGGWLSRFDAWLKFTGFAQ